MSKFGAACLGFGIAYLVGVAKEKMDERHGDLFDTRDLCFDIIGACMGAVLFLI